MSSHAVNATQKIVGMAVHSARGIGQVRVGLDACYFKFHLANLQRKSGRLQPPRLDRRPVHKFLAVCVGHVPTAKPNQGQVPAMTILSIPICG